MWVSNYKKFKLNTYNILETHVIECQLCNKYVRRKPITIKNFVIHTINTGTLENNKLYDLSC